MKFNKKEFKTWFSPETNYINPDWKPKNLWDPIYIILWCLTFGWLVTPIALCVAMEFKK